MKRERGRNDGTAVMAMDTPFTEPGSPWEHEDIEGFNARLREELLYEEIS